MHDWAEDHGRTHGGDREVGLLVLDEFPGGFFSEGFGGAVAVCGVLDGFFHRYRVPVEF